MLRDKMHSSQPLRNNVQVFLDALERVVLSVIFSFFAWKLGQSWLTTGSIITLIALVSEGAVLFFVLFRRFTTEVSMLPGDWLLAFLGTATPLLVQPSGNEGLAPQALCAALMLVGMSVQIAAKLTLRRSFGAVAANRGVKKKGPYRLVRHPMYAGYILTQIGFLLSYPSVFNLAVYSAAFAFQIGRILAVERVLARDASYRDFTAAVPYRLVPGVF
ncbi:methyltransferase [Devosia sp. 1635]|uniref:methyltransferase family protein n=1 Tax=Devosia sp. 1635 TaxID=2726066 RepID=UPI001564B81F|nr:methyltransferase [Devosia sp. 1635]